MKKTLPSPYLSVLCREIALMLHAGIGLSDGIALLAEDEADPAAKSALSAVAEALEAQSRARDAFEKAGAFPKYMTDMIGIGEATGSLESVFDGLSDFYERREQISVSIRNAVFYPLVLFFMMLFVLTLILTKVMPIFSDVYTQLGGTMSGFASALTDFGRSISGGWLWIAGVIAALALAAFILSKNKRVKRYFSGKLENLAFSAGLAKAAARARFASVMAMGLAAGLDFDRSLELSESVVTDKKMLSKISACREKIHAGESTGKVLAEAGIFTNVQAQMLTIGLRTGSAEAVMHELAARTGNELADLTDIKLSKIEPTLVIIMSLLVGAILLTVMLPLMSIMATL